MVSISAILRLIAVMCIFVGFIRVFAPPVSADAMSKKFRTIIPECFYKECNYYKDFYVEVSDPFTTINPNNNTLMNFL